MLTTLGIQRLADGTHLARGGQKLSVNPLSHLDATPWKPTPPATRRFPFDASTAQTGTAVLSSTRATQIPTQSEQPASRSRTFDDAWNVAVLCPDEVRAGSTKVRTGGLRTTSGRTEQGEPGWRGG